jgi:hypothetical protein
VSCVTQVVPRPRAGHASARPRWRATRPKSTGASHAPIDHIRRIDRAQPSEVEQKLRRTPASTTRRTRALHASVEGLADRVGSPQRVGRSAGRAASSAKPAGGRFGDIPEGGVVSGVQRLRLIAGRVGALHAVRRSGLVLVAEPGQVGPKGHDPARPKQQDRSRRGWRARRRNRRHVRPSAHRGLRGSFCPLPQVGRSVRSRWWS